MRRDAILLDERQNAMLAQMNFGMLLDTMLETDAKRHHASKRRHICRN
jgi:hypothetical protein